MKYIDAEHLRKEVKRLEKAAHKFALGCADSETRKFHEGKDFAYQHIGFLIDSLQHEQPEVDLKKEIETYFKGWYMDETDQGYILHTPDDHAGLMSVKQVARHFYELGLNAKEE